MAIQLLILPLATASRAALSGLFASGRLAARVAGVTVRGAAAAGRISARAGMAAARVGGKGAKATARHAVRAAVLQPATRGADILAAHIREQGLDRIDPDVAEARDELERQLRVEHMPSVQVEVKSALARAAKRVHDQRSGGSSQEFDNAMRMALRHELAEAGIQLQARIPHQPSTPTGAF